MNLRKITIISGLIITFFLIPFNILILKHIYKNNLITSGYITKYPYIEIQILNFAKDKYEYYSKNLSKIEEVFLEVILKNFSENFYIKKQNENFRHYLEKLKNPAAINLLRDLDILTIKKDYVDTLNKYSDQNYIENEIKLQRNKINLLKENYKNEHVLNLKNVEEDILKTQNKIDKLINFSKVKFKALENEMMINIFFPTTKYTFQDLKLMNSYYLKKLNTTEVVHIKINIVISIIILNSIYILISILIIRNLNLMFGLNFFVFKKKNYKKIRK